MGRHSFNPNDRDREILLTLTRKVRVLSVPQVGRTWWGSTADPEGNASKRLALLAQAGLVERVVEMAHPELSVEEPALRWEPGDAEPDLGALAYRFQSRWREHPVPTALVHATRAANGFLGGYIGGRRPRRSEVTHDLHVAVVYLWHRLNDGEAAAVWASEHELYADGEGRGTRLPDARLKFGEADPRRRIVEFGGAYAKAKLEEFHEAFRDERYEVW